MVAQVGAGARYLNKGPSMKTYDKAGKGWPLISCSMWGAQFLEWLVTWPREQTAALIINVQQIKHGLLARTASSGCMHCNLLNVVYICVMPMMCDEPQVLWCSNRVI